MTDPKSPSSSQTSPREPAGCLGTLVRLSWMVLGSGALIVLTLLISQAGRFSALDALFWVVVAGMVLLRYIDITRLGGLTSSLAPATLRDWGRYVALLLGIAVTVWALAHTLMPALFR